MKPTGSAIGRAAACPASCALPQQDTRSSAADRGNAVHAFLAAVVLQPTLRGSALASVTREHKAFCESIDLLGLLAGLELDGTNAEVAMAFDVQAGRARIIGVNIGRNYGQLADSEIACSADLVARRSEDGAWVIRDWKTGLDLGDVEDSWQLRVQALCVRALTGAETIDAGYVYLEEGGPPRVVQYVFDALDLDAALDELRAILGRVRRAESMVAAKMTPETSAGEHCKYCPALPYCPSQTALARAMLPELEAIDSQIGALSIEQAGAAWAKARQVRSLLTRVEDGLKARASSEPLPLPGGKVLKMLPMSGRRTLDMDGAIAELRRLGAEEATIAGLLREGKPYAMAKEVKP